MIIRPYSEIRPQIQTGDAFFYRGNGVVSRLIRCWSRGYNHVGLAVRFPRYAGQSDRIWTLEALGVGVSLGLLSERISGYRGRVFWFPLRPGFDPCRDQIKEFALAQAGKKYDFGGLLKSMFGRVIPDLTEVTCNEYAALAYEYAGVLAKLERVPYPGDLAAAAIFGEPVEVTA